MRSFDAVADVDQAVVRRLGAVHRLAELRDQRRARDRRRRSSNRSGMLPYAPQKRLIAPVFMSSTATRLLP